MVYYWDTPENAKYLASKTGLDPNVAMAWLRMEGQSVKNPTNPLNIRFYGIGSNYGQTGHIGGFATYASTKAGLDAAAGLINNSSYYAGIRKAIKTGDPAAQARAIEKSPWAAGHYGGANGPGGISRVLEQILGKQIDWSKYGDLPAAGGAVVAAAKGTLAEYLGKPANTPLTIDLLKSFYEKAAGEVGENPTSLWAYYFDFIGKPLGEIPAPGKSFDEDTFGGATRSEDPVTAVANAITGIGNIAVKMITYLIAFVVILVGIWVYVKAQPTEMPNVEV